MKRVLIVVLDSVGVGALPDASFYGDEGSNTLANMAASAGGLNLPLLGALGIGCLTEVAGVPCAKYPEAAYGKMSEMSPGKDTTTGHWEMTGLVLEKPFPTYPHGFPPSVMKRFSSITGGKPALGNCKASGTEIIEKLGLKHLQTGRPIVYTSADSVFQVAAHEDVVPLSLLYQWCSEAREILSGEHAVGRVIARPFAGREGGFYRTPNRKDYSLEPPGKTLLDRLAARGKQVVTIGKVSEIFAGRGISVSIPTANNDDGVSKLLTAMDEFSEGLIFINLIEFDMIFGHRNDASGYGKALERFDEQLSAIIGKMQDEDVLFITADHGCDPTMESHTDHTREYVPLLVYGKNIRAVNLGVRKSFADLGETVGCFLGLPPSNVGQSFCGEVMN